jgi:glutamate/tyrosine decarboxylase-like PLP-dependent enzyme
VTWRRAARYLDGIRERRVAPSAEAVSALAAFREPLPAEPAAPEEVLAMLDRFGSPATMGMAGPRFFGFVIGGSLPAALGANWLASAWDQNAGLFAATPVSALLEEVSPGWLSDVLQPEGCGALSSPAPPSPTSPLSPRRDMPCSSAPVGMSSPKDSSALPKSRPSSARKEHPSVFKSLGVLGPGRDRVVRVPVNGQGRMRADSLPPFRPPSIVCVQAGNVNTGAFDPLPEICRRAHAAGARVHVDGAFGLWAAASPRCAVLAAGVAADSWATDATSGSMCPTIAVSPSCAILRFFEPQ